MQPFVEKQIKDLTEDNVKVAISGMVVERGNNHFVIDDGTGTLIIRSDSENTSKMVKVFGNLTKFEDNMELNSLIVKDISDIDQELFKKFKSEYSF